MSIPFELLTTPVFYCLSYPLMQQQYRMASTTGANVGLQHVSLSLSAERHAIAPASMVSLARQERDATSVSDGTFEMNHGDLGSVALQKRFSPFNICAPADFLLRVRDTHYLLDKALINIVDRWFHDTDAKFSERMPLQEHEEDLLRWIDSFGKSIIPSFASSYGMWRTDYLIERNANGHEQIKICEINSRIPYNGIWTVHYHEEMTKRVGGFNQDFPSPNNFDVTREAIFACFDCTKPLHYIREKWGGVDGPAFARDFERHTGQKVILIRPSDLRLQLDPTSPTGHTLHHSINGTEKTQQVHQCTLELFQEEYRGLDPAILRQIATHAVNDLRNVFLIHDKRILGIILDELPKLESLGVLTHKELSQLKDAIADTLLPGSVGMQDLLRKSEADERLKDQYFVKPVRDASGKGIRPGSLFPQSEWLTLLKQQVSHPLTPEEGACVIQRLVNHIQYDITRHGLGFTEPEKFHLIGSQHLINSKVNVYGPWRIGNDRGHVGFSKPDVQDLGICMSAVIRPEGLSALTELEL